MSFSPLRMWIHRHNSLRGHVAMALQQMKNIGSTSSVTNEARKLAWEIEVKLLELDCAFKTRNDEYAPPNAKELAARKKADPRDWDIPF